jgi:cysteine-rich repeat protein
MSARISRVLSSTFVVAFLLASVLPTPSAVAVALTPEQKCRSELQLRNTRYIGASHRIRQRCLRGIFSGKLPVTTDCVTGVGDAKASSALDKIRARVSVRLPRACAGIDLGLLGYPGDCRDETGSPFDEFDLERCLIDQGDAIVAEMLDTEYPPVRWVPGQYLHCVNGVGVRGGATVRAELKARSECSFRDEIDPLVEGECRAQIVPYGPGTANLPTNDRILRAYVGLLAGVPDVCSGANVDFLGYTDDCVDNTGGRFNSFDLKLCLFDTHRAYAQKALELAFPSQPVCGDGTVDADEECDDGNSIETDSCLSDCTAARCGDGFVQTGVEECDDGNGVQTDACLNNCAAAKCGDSVVRTGVEECDDGNASNNDACLTTCTAADCGDNIVCTSLTCKSGPGGGPEDCDDGNNASGDGCDAACGIEFCGDAIINNKNEQCDDGPLNANAPNQCRPGTCKLPFCGDGIVDDAAPYNETCDPPNGTACSEECTALLCGNGQIDEGEECDDGANNSNTVPDACRRNCVEAFCGDGVVDTDEACDDRNTSNNDTCLNSCAENVCGDGFVRTGVEECDDGANNSNTIPDACRTTCENAGCGDGVVDSGEVCDDGNQTPTDACTNACVDNVCGDGILFAGVEECDDGGANSDTAPNACRSDCREAGCGDGVIDSGEECDGANAAACAPSGEICNGACSCAPAANECPGLGELTLKAGYGIPCGSNDDCGVGVCDPVTARCKTATELDTGWTGISHDADVNDDQVLLGNIECASGTAPCGVCEVAGINPTNGVCRCVNNNRVICDQPFRNDTDDCGGQLCTCYLGPPLPLSAGNTPACVVNRFAADISGTANVDLGAGNINVSLRSVVFLGQGLTIPCPYCEGDPIPADGVRGGVCRFGKDVGQSCDVDAISTTFPAPGGDGHSLDCFPDPGKNVSGTGLVIELAQTTSSVSLFADVDCGFPPFVKEECHCGICSGNGSFPCSSNTDCEVAGFGLCQSRGFGDPRANQCAGAGGCTLGPDGDATCDEGPEDKYCDAVVRASGEGFIQCLGNADCSIDTIGVAAGSCTLTKVRECFSRTIDAVGAADPETPIGAAIFCIPPTGNAGINQVAGLPGPGRILNQGRSRLFCASDPSVQYTPGVGGCP